MTRLIYPDLAAGGWRNLRYELLRPGIEVAWLVKGEAGEPSVAVLSYAPGAAVPRHRHPGLETIVVLDGVQSDDSGDYGVGSVVFNPPGTEHAVWSEHGCVVLIQWDRPIVFLGDGR